MRSRSYLIINTRLTIIALVLLLLMTITGSLLMIYSVTNIIRQEPNHQKTFTTIISNPKTYYSGLTLLIFSLIAAVLLVFAAILTHHADAEEEKQSSSDNSSSREQKVDASENILIS